MTVSQIDAPPPWSLQSPGSSPPVQAGLRRGRPEEASEQRHFAAAMARLADRPAAASADPATNPAAAEVATRLPSRPEERQSGEAAVGVRNDGFFGGDGFGIADVIDTINPLQHIPGVSTVYRALTGDEISPGARLAGGTLYGGPIGFASALADNVSESVTGRDMVGSVYAAMSGDETTGTAVAQAAPDAASDAVAADAVADDAAAAQAASVAPAAGAPTPAPVPGPVAAAAPPSAAPRSQASPLMAAQPVGSPFASVPNGGSPMAVLRPPGAPNIRSLNQGRAAMPGETPDVSTPAAAAAQGAPNLSPDAATVLMRMAQQSQGNAPPVSMTPPQAPMTPPPRIPSAPPATAIPSTAPAADPAPSTASATAGSQTTRPPADRSQTAAYFDPVPSEDLPSAMMDALQKYESMKQ